MSKIKKPSIFQKLHFLTLKNGVKRAEYLRKNNILAEIGQHCLFQPYKMPMDPKLVKLHNNVYVAAGVSFITHDASRHMLAYLNKQKYARNLGCIEIMDNCFIGLNAILMPNIKIEEKVIVGAGSVVTKSVPSNSVVAGNPAKIIGKFDDFDSRMQEKTTKVGLSDYGEDVKKQWKKFDHEKKGYIK